MKVIFSTNVPSPYRVDFFNELGKHCDLVVCYERHTATDRDAKWQGTTAKNFKEIYLPLKPVGTDRAKGSALRKYISSNDFDVLILTNYVSPATTEAILYCKLKKITYCVEYDGGFNKQENIFKRTFKKLLLKGAYAHLTTADEHIKYLKSLGINEKRIYKYPFTSLKKEDLINADAMQEKGKAFYKEKLGIKEDKIILSVGQFIHRKGYDILLQAVKDLDKSIGVYIVGGEPTKEYIDLKDKMRLANVHFVGFKMKDELAEYYCATDLFVLPTREDIWGLVINEAMAYGLPIVTTDKCIAGLELVKNGENGYIISAEDVFKTHEAIFNIISDSFLFKKYGQKSREIIDEYTIEKMAERHINIFNNYKIID